MKKFLLVLAGAALMTLGAKAAVNEGGENPVKGIDVVQEEIKEGVQAPDFTLKDLQGNDFKLSSLYGKGKYTLLDFWGSWCIWCIRGLPEMKATYEKYKDQVEFLSIDCRESEVKWRAGVEKHQIPWLHVYNPAGEGDVAKAYEVQGYPWKILLDENGKIVKIVMGEDPEFYTYMDSVFGK